MKSSNRSWIMITGATGYLGRYLLRELSCLGYRLILLVRSREKGEALLVNLPTIPENVWIVEGDITLPRLGLSPEIYCLLRKRLGFILHCAALTRFNPSPIQAFSCNVIGTRNLLMLAQETGQLSSFHYVSTAYVAGRKKGMVGEEELDGRVGFNNLYEKSKFLAESLLQHYQRKNRDRVTIYRPGIIIGDLRTGSYRNDFGLYHFLFLLNRLNNHLPIRLLGNPWTTKNLVPIDYVVGVMIHILLNNQHWGKVYHLTSPYPPTLELLEEAFNRTLGSKVVQLALEEEFQAKPRNRWEALVAHQIRPYQPYLLSEPLFDSSNTRLALEGSGITSPIMDLETLVFLLSNTQRESRSHAPARNFG